MLKEVTTGAQVSNFQLKHQAVDLLPSATTVLAQITLGELEAMRTTRPAVPASRHGLEAICGASCETGAQ